MPILEQFLQEERMVRLLCEAGDAETLLADREVLLTRITALPDHSANKLQHANRPLFYPENYYPLLAREMLAALGRIHQSLRGECVRGVGHGGGGSVSGVGHGRRG